MHSDIEILHHIRDEMVFIIGRSSNISEKDFLDDETLKRAFARSLEIIGEAVKKLSAGFITANSNIEWRSMAGMRDKLIHGYFSVDYSIIWDVAVNKIPSLHNAINHLIDTAH